MSASRVVLRWLLTLLAVGLAVVALLISGLRLAMQQADWLRDDIGVQLTRQFNASMRLGEFGAALQGLDPVLAIEDLRLTSQAGIDSFPLLDIKQARVRLDTSASLHNGYPVLGNMQISAATLHLYQDRHGRWSWPGPAEFPTELFPDSRFEIEGLDLAVGILLRQQAYAENIKLVLHGIEDTVTLVAPRLDMAGGEQKAHMEGRIFIEGEQDSSLEAVLEITTNGHANDLDAALQVRADLGALSRLGRLMTSQVPLSLDHMQGKADVWGFWRDGRLQDARARLAIADLTLDGEGAPLTLHDLTATAQWLRGEQDHWQAWINPPSIVGAPNVPSPLPGHLYAEGDNQDWLLRSTPFDIGALIDWSQRLPLPQSVDRALQNLAPTGQVAGLEVGWQKEVWQGRALLHGMTVSPWDDVPGGGPFNAWIEAKDNQGRVWFEGLDDMTLSFPEIFETSMALDRAAGEIGWEYQNDSWMIAGERLAAQWRGAGITGEFRLTPPGTSAGEFELNLEMADMNAIDIPLMDWLPAKVLSPDLRDWLAGGVAGRVPQGSLHIQQVLKRENSAAHATAPGDAIESFDGQLRLALQIEDGRLPYDPQWPALENVSGKLSLDGERLHAEVAHAETLGLVSEGGEVSLQDEQLRVQAPVRGSTQALLDFLAAAPVEGMEAFSRWQSVGEVQGQMALRVPMTGNADEADSDAFQVDIEASVDAPSLTFSQVGLTLGNVNGELQYRHTQNRDLLTGELGARAFDGPLLARFDVGGEGVSLEGRALARGLLDWAGMPGLEGLLAGYFPYSAHLDLSGEAPRLTLDSDLQGLAILLPAPFGKQPDQHVPLHVGATPGELVRVDVAERLRLRWRARGTDSGQGQVWLERWPASPDWPAGPGWEFIWRTPALALERWQETLAGLSLPKAGAGGTESSPAVSPPPLHRLLIDTDCLQWEQRCLGSLNALAKPLVDGWRVDLDGSLVEGLAEYRPRQPSPLAITLSRLHLDTLLADATMPASTELLDQIATAPEPMALPGSLGRLPNGKIQIDALLRDGRELGPLNVRWEATPQRLRLSPLSLALGEITATGELVWESSGPEASLTRSRIALSGGDLGSMIEALGQPVPLRSESTQVQTQLAWPGAPWQFALVRSRGSIEAELVDGRFLTLESPSARLIGLLNIDNLLRRLRLDFSDVTGQGTAFDSVTGSATLYGGRLETRGPIEIDGPSTQFSLDGSVDLAARRLNMLLGITVPVSQNLPLAAVLVGAPYVGGALFLADKVLGGWLDKVTRIYYRVRGPWASPQITLENAE